MWNTDRLSPARVFCIAALALLTSACQPTVEQRFADAEAYLAQGDHSSAIIELKNVLQAEGDRLDARLMLADALYVQNDLQGAESEYRRILSSGHDDPSVWVSYGRSLLAQGKAAEALSTVEPTLGSVQESVAAAVVGDIYLALGNLATAGQHYGNAIELNPTDAGAMTGRALVAAGQGRFEQATDYIDAAVREHASDPLVLRTRADILVMRQQYTQAAAAYDRAIEAESVTTPYFQQYVSRQNRIVALIEARELDKAAQYLDAFAELLPDYPTVHFLRGQIAFGHGDNAVAESEMLRYLAQVPGDPRGQAILGAIKFSQNNLGQAEQYLSSAVRSDTGGQATRLMLAETLLRLNQPEQASDILGSLGNSGGPQQDAVVLAMLGRAKLGQGDAQAAIDYFQQSMNKDGDSANVSFALASSYIATGRADDAIDLLIDLPAGSAGNYRREMLLMGAYLEDGRASDAEAVAYQLIRENPDDANVHALAGVLHNNLQQGLRAKAQLNTALDIDPENAGALYALGVMALDDNTPEEAISLFNRLLDVQPAHLPALIQLANAHAETNSLAEVLPRLEEANDAAPGAAVLRKLRSQVELRLGNTQAALEQAGAGRQSFPDDPGFIHLDGLSRLQEGDVKAAIDSFERAVSLQPENPTYQLDLARAYLVNGDFDRAIKAVRVYRSQRPADIRGLSIEVDAQLRGGDPTSAKRSVTAYEEEYPDRPFALMLFGDIELASGNADAAIEFYDDYAENNWNRVVALRLAGAHQAAGTGKAIDYVERWLAEEPDDIGMRRLYGQILEGNGRTREAVSEYERLEHNGDLDAIGLNNLAWQYMLSGKAGASELAERAHRLRPGNGEIADTWGWILYREGKFEQAVDTLRTAAELSPGNPEIRYHLAAALSESGAGAEARKIVSDLLVANADFPSRPEAEALLRSL